PPWRIATIPVAVVTSVLVGFPLITGDVVADTRPKLPPAHVQLPAYWEQMADVVDERPTRGAVLVLPPDDFYGMPYKWGYYGADDFIANLFRRPVVVPNPQGSAYVSASTELLSAIDQTAQSILSHDWRQTEALVTAMNTPLVLVRGDIVTPYEGRPIVSPAALADALTVSPNFSLVRKTGLLDLFELKSATSDPETTRII